MLAVGSVVAGYRVQRVLGTGGMGTVYVVANPELPRLDALKVLSAELSRDPEFRSRFLREAEVASRLDHPNIVSIYRRGETDDGQLWMAMQFVDGTDADEALRRGQMTPQRAIHIAAEVAKALDYAHRHQVIHRDVKPANLLLSGPVGAEERVLLGDFGIARALDDVSLTGTGAVMATLSYAAPEIIAGDPPDGRADLYSLACSLFRLLTGKTPFADAHGAAAMMMAHLQQPPPRVTAVAPWLPAGLDDVIATAMAKDPARRFATGAEFAAAAAAALHQPGYRHPAPAPDRSPAPRGRHRAKIVGALAAVGVLAIGAVAAITWKSHGGRSPDQHTTISGTAAPTSTTAAAVAATALPGLLLSPDDLGAIMAVPLQAGPVSDVIAEDRDWISEPGCAGAFWPAEAAAYDHSGWTALRAQQLTQQPSGAATVVQAVVAFPSLSRARDLFVKQEGQWLTCSSRAFTVTKAGPAHAWTFGGLNHQGDVDTMSAAQVGGDISCARAMTLRGNVVVDVSACRPGASTQAVVDIADRIAANVPG
ncbi:serine/threonine-protein kinase PknH/PknJ [Mycobacterium sp. pUA109]|uniref:serine/threonine-protein kinase PknH/PknJ n=1 Tax=Mycobacterium sp. pUA109 TaxID=3238982 RepID=UPI00351B0DF8